jgi:hypothetical protein
MAVGRESEAHPALGIITSLVGVMGRFALRYLCSGKDHGEGFHCADHIFNLWASLRRKDKGQAAASERKKGRAMADPACSCLRRKPFLFPELSPQPRQPQQAGAQEPHSAGDRHRIYGGRQGSVAVQIILTNYEVDGGADSNRFF